MINRVLKAGVSWVPSFGHFRSIGRLVLLAGLVGVVAGLGAVVFQVLSHVVVRYGLQMVAGYYPDGPAGESDFLGTATSLTGGFSPWLLLAVVAAGGLISGFLVYTFAPEAEA